MTNGDEGNHNYYFFDISKGELIFSKSDLPKRKTNIILVLNREKLFYNEFTVKTKKRLKINEILNIQRSHIPFNEKITNIIYKNKKKKKDRYFFWISPAVLEEEQIVYDEVPESLIFKGDPQKIKNYNVFVFQRHTGFEVIYFDGDNFFSLFEKNVDKVSWRIVLLARKYSHAGDIKILSEIEITDLDPKYHIDFIETDEKYFFLPNHFPFLKIFSNISEDKHIKDLKSLMGLSERYMLIFFIIVIPIFLFCMSFRFILIKNRNNLRERYKEVSGIFNKSQKIEFKINKIKKKIFSYPEYLKYLKIIYGVIDDESYITEYVQLENKIMVTVFSKNRLKLEKKLKENKIFKEVKITSSLDKGLRPEKNIFVFEILLNKNV